MAWLVNVPSYSYVSVWISQSRPNQCRLENFINWYISIINIHRGEGMWVIYFRLVSVPKVWMKNSQQIHGHVYEWKFLMTEVLSQNLHIYALIEDLEKYGWYTIVLNFTPIPLQNRRGGKKKNNTCAIQPMNLFYNYLEIMVQVWGKTYIQIFLFLSHLPAFGQYILIDW